MNDSSAPKNSTHSSFTPAKSRPWSPWIRLGLLGLFLGTLSFPWGETSSCNGPTHIYTGYEQLQRSSSDVIPFLVLFGLPPALGFLQFLARAAWVRMCFELVATLFSGVGASYCFLSAAIGGNLLTKSWRFYPAPWLATMLITFSAFDALWGAFQQVHTIFWPRKKTVKTDEPVPDKPPST